MSVTEFFKQNFNTQRDQWEKSLRAELKIEDATSKTSKKSAEGAWPTLSLEAIRTHQLRPTEAWKKAAQTYVRPSKTIEDDIRSDLDGGTRLFFFEKDFIDQSEWEKISSVLGSFSHANEIVVILLGDRELKPGTRPFRIIDEAHMFTGRGAWAPGGTIIQELSQIALGLTDGEIGNEVHLGVFLDSQFFRNIAKVRAARLLATKILGLRNLHPKIFITGLTSYREWTLYERYSNILRNDASVASGLIAGCDFVQSSGYETLFELEVAGSSSEHGERSRRMARNTSHILALESMLGLVEDASFGSYHLENLTEEYARGAWELMQKLLPMSESEVSAFFLKETTPVSELRQKNLSTRRHVLAGLNDFPDTKDSLNLTAQPVSRFFRTGRVFEELRLRMEKVKNPPDVYLAIFGDYAALNARINFVKNYFELLGLRVTDPGHPVKKEDVALRQEKILVLVSADDMYPELTGIKTNASEKFIAGKTPAEGFQNLFAGQDVYEVLSGIVNRWGNK